MTVLTQHDLGGNRPDAKAWLIEIDGSTENQLRVYSDVVAATASLLWPLLTLILVAMFRSQIRQLLLSFNGRIADKNLSVKLGPIELSRRVEVLESKAYSESESDKLDREFFLQHVRVAKSTYDQELSLTELRDLAGQYLSVSIADWRERLRVKDQLAVAMARLIIEKGIPRELLAGEKDEGIFLGLVTAIHTLPNPDDARWIATFAAGVRLKHVRYRVMMAIARLSQLGFLTPSDRDVFAALAGEYRIGADAYLELRIERTLSLLL